MILLNTPKLSKLFNIKNHNVIKSQEFPKLTHTYQSFVEKMKLKFSLMGYSFKTNSALHSDVCRVYLTMKNYYT